jgi:hypothetical protein
VIGGRAALSRSLLFPDVNRASFLVATHIERERRMRIRRPLMDAAQVRCDVGLDAIPSVGLAEPDPCVRETLQDVAAAWIVRLQSN